MYTCTLEPAPRVFKARLGEPFLRNFPEPAGTNGRRIAVQIGGVLQYKLEVYCGVSLSPKLRSQQGTALQMRGVLRCKLEVYCECSLDKLDGGWGFLNSAHFLGFLMFFPSCSAQSRPSKVPKPVGGRFGYFFFCLLGGGAGGSPRRQGWGSSVFIESHGRGGSPMRRGGGPRGWEGICGESLGGEG